MPNVFIVFMVALTLGCLTSAVVYILICLLSATYDLSFKEIITLRFFKSWLNEIVEYFSLKGGVLVCAVFSLLFFLPCYDATTKIEKENLGECTCRCKACKATQKELDALIERIGVNNEKEEFQSFKKNNFNDGLKTSMHEELSCRSKQRYESFWHAKFAADEQMSFHPGLKLKVYECQYCNGRHLASCQVNETLI